MLTDPCFERFQINEQLNIVIDGAAHAKMRPSRMDPAVSSQYEHGLKKFTKDLIIFVMEILSRNH